MGICFTFGPYSRVSRRGNEFLQIEIGVGTFKIHERWIRRFLNGVNPIFWHIIFRYNFLFSHKVAHPFLDPKFRKTSIKQKRIKFPHRIEDNYVSYRLLCWAKIILTEVGNCRKLLIDNSFCGELHLSSNIIKTRTISND